MALRHAFRPFYSGSPAITIYASPTGDDTAEGTYDAPMRDPRAALRKAGSSCTLKLFPGSYGPITFREEVSGSQNRPTTIDAVDQDDPPIFGGTVAGAPQHGLQIAGTDPNWGATHDVILRGLRVVDAQLDGIRGYGSRITIENCVVSGSRRQGIEWIGNDTDWEGLRIINCVIEQWGGEDPTSNQFHGIYANGDGITIASNIIRNPQNTLGYGLHLWPKVGQVSVVSNTITGSWASIIAGMAVPGNSVAGVSIINNILGRHKDAGVVDKDVIYIPTLMHPNDHAGSSGNTFVE